MDKKGFELLIENGLVASVTLFRDLSKPGTGWIMQITDDNGMSWSGSYIRDARGKTREFKTLEAGLKYSRDCGWRHCVMIDELWLPKKGEQDVH